MYRLQSKSYLTNICITVQCLEAEWYAAGRMGSHDGSLDGSPRVARTLALARLLTRTGDHAWDLAMPLALMNVIPGTLRLLASYFLTTRLAVVVAMPLLGRWIDHSDRLRVVRTAVLLEAIGVAAGALLISRSVAAREELALWLPLALVAGVAAAIGGAIMNVSLVGRWVPAAFSGTALAQVNARLSQADLVTEVAAPVAAGMLMAFTSSIEHPLRGFHAVAAVDLLSFALEYALLARAYAISPALSAPAPEQPPGASTGPVDGLALTLSQPTLPVLLAYGLLWFTVLTPHGALLTSFLKSQWGFDERLLGMLRGAGALAGLLPTVIYPRLARAIGPARAAAGFIALQCGALVAACLAMGAHGVTAFVATLLASRVGLYGFVLAEVQLFQERVPHHVRGRVGAVASAYNNALGLAIYVLALSLPDSGSFATLAWASCTAVALAALLVAGWSLCYSAGMATSPVAVGDRAPDFSRKSYDGSPVQLSALLERKAVVLFFYPKDFSPLCTVQVCAFRDAYQDFTKAGAEVIGVSADADERHSKFSQEHKLPYILISDGDGKLRELYGVPKAMLMFPGRTTYVIDRGGVVRDVFTANLQAEGHVKHALEVLAGSKS